jgi:hypothetical protein
MWMIWEIFEWISADLSSVFKCFQGRVVELGLPSTKQLAGVNPFPRWVPLSEYTSLGGPKTAMT